MGKKEAIKYMNPITFEAEMFLKSLETLSNTYNIIDANLVTSLEKVVKAIETFMDTNQHEVFATETTKLVACNIENIRRIYHCSNCKTDLGKSSEKVTLHLIESCAPHPSLAQNGESNSTANCYYEKEPKKEKSKKEKSKRGNKHKKSMCQPVKLTKKTCKLLTTNYEQFFATHKEISEKLKCLPAYKSIENDLLSIVKPLFPNQKVKIYKFGSRLSGIGTRESDLDLFIDIGGTFHNFEHRANSEAVAKLRKIGETLYKIDEAWTGLFIIDKARVPILHAVHINTSIECDINISNSLGVINTEILEFMFSLQPIARFLCIFMKKWLERTCLSEVISSYSMILMVLFYLQNLNVLPTVEELQQDFNEENALTVGPWLCSFKTIKEMKMPREKLQHDNFLTYVKGFFKFYTSFNYDDNIICPYFGKPVKRTELYGLMPERYKNYVKDFPDCALKINNAMVIQDPIQLNHSVTKAVSSLQHKIIITYMANSLKML